MFPWEAQDSAVPNTFRGSRRDRNFLVSHRARGAELGVNSSGCGTGVDGSRHPGRRRGHGSSRKGLLKGRGGSEIEKHMHSPSLAARDSPDLDFPYGESSQRNHPGGAQSNPSTPDGPEGLLLLVPARHILQIPLWSSPNAEASP